MSIAKCDVDFFNYCQSSINRRCYHNELLFTYVLLCRVVSCRVVLYCFVLCRVVLFCVVSCCVVSCCVVLFCVVSCCFVLCRVVSCRVVSCVFPTKRSCIKSSASSQFRYSSGSVRRHRFVGIYLPRSHMVLLLFHFTCILLQNATNKIWTSHFMCVF